MFLIFWFCVHVCVCGIIRCACLKCIAFVFGSKPNSTFLAFLHYPCVHGMALCWTNVQIRSAVLMMFNRRCCHTGLGKHVAQNSDYPSIYLSTFLLLSTIWQRLLWKFQRMLHARMKQSVTRQAKSKQCLVYVWHVKDLVQTLGAGKFVFFCKLEEKPCVENRRKPSDYQKKIGLTKKTAKTVELCDSSFKHVFINKWYLCKVSFFVHLTYGWFLQFIYS